MDASRMKLVGGIDALNGGILSGWAADLNSKKVYQLPSTVRIS